MSNIIKTSDNYIECLSNISVSYFLLWKNRMCCAKDRAHGRTRIASLQRDL